MSFISKFVSKLAKWRREKLYRKTHFLFSVPGGGREYEVTWRSKRLEIVRMVIL